MSCEVGCSEVDYKSILILSEMVYVKQMHKDCFSVVSESFGIKRKLGIEGGLNETKQGRGKEQFPCCCVFGLFKAQAQGKKNDHLLGKT